MIGTAEPVPVVLALGSNLGDRDGHLRAAVAGLSSVAGLWLRARSRLVETDPVGGPTQQPYLNAVLLAQTTLPPLDLLHACQAIENSRHRVRAERWGPRTLDIDIITYGQVVDDDERLTLPHPRAHQRAFVLLPWSQVDPQATLPGHGAVAALAARAPDRLGVRAYRSPPLSLDDLADLLDEDTW